MAADGEIIHTLLPTPVLVCITQDGQLEFQVDSFNLADRTRQPLFNSGDHVMLTAGPNQFGALDNISAVDPFIAANSTVNHTVHTLKEKQRTAFFLQLCFTASNRKYF